MRTLKIDRRYSTFIEVDAPEEVKIHETIGFHDTFRNIKQKQNKTFSNSNVQIQISNVLSLST